MAAFRRDAQLRSIAEEQDSAMRAGDAAGVATRRWLLGLRTKRVRRGLRCPGSGGSAPAAADDVRFRDQLG